MTMNSFIRRGLLVSGLFAVMVAAVLAPPTPVLFWVLVGGIAANFALYFWDY